MKPPRYAMPQLNTLDAPISQTMFLDFSVLEYDLNANSLLPFKSSRWFTRAWMLQELIAPVQVYFFGQGWCYLGSRDRLSSIIRSITRIPGSGPNVDMRWWHLELGNYSVAQMMSWAARRQCTRIEDSAYCLLGIFDINMPLLYGEGNNAFLRLQEEIFKVRDDYSLLAWTQVSRAQLDGIVFAKSPLDFLHIGNIVRFHSEDGPPSVVTKKGLQVSLCLEQASPLLLQYYPLDILMRVFYVMLNCGIKSAKGKIRVLLVVRMNDGDGGRFNQFNCYRRIHSSRHFGVRDRNEFRDPSKYKTVFLQTRRQIFDGIYPGLVSTGKYTKVIFRVHGISFDFIQGSQDSSNQALGYTVEKAIHFIEGTKALKLMQILTPTKSILKEALIYFE